MIVIFFSDSIFKLLHVFGGIIERKLIAKELNDNIQKLTETLCHELEIMDDIMKTQKRMVRDFGGPIVDRNMPRVTGQLSLIQEMKLRLETSVSSLKNVSHPIVEGQEAARIIEKSTEMIEILVQQEKDIYKTWASMAEKNTIKVV